MHANAFVERLQQNGYEVHRHGREWRAQCPAHGGEDCNLAISDGDFAVFLSCWSRHCDPMEIAAAVGVKPNELWFDERPQFNGNGAGGEQRIFPYRDEKGELLYEVHRVEATADRDKDFTMWLPGAERAGGTKDVRRVLFGLPELLKTQPGEVVGIAEGEKCALAVALLGVPCTTNPNGSGKWREAYTQWLKENLPERRFLVLPDNDTEGKKHALAVCDSLKAAGLKVWLADLGELPPKGDVVQWIARGGTAEQLRAMAADPPHPFDALVFNGPRLMEAVIPEPTWLVPGFVARAVAGMLVGVGKLGKSVLAHQLTAAGATPGGGVWLDQPVPGCRTLYVNWEDPLGLTRARAVQQFETRDLPAAYHAMQPPWGTRLLDWLAWLEVYALREGIELVVLDPLAIAAGWKDENDNAEVGPTMRAIQEVAQRTGAAMLVVHHSRKSPGEGGMEVRGGSAIFTGIQGFMSFRRKGEGLYELDTLNKMPGEYGGERTLLLRRSPHTLTWHLADEQMTRGEFEREVSIGEIKANVRVEPGITRQRLAALIGVSERTLKRYLEPLLERGDLFEARRPRPEGGKGQRPIGIFCRDLLDA